MSGDQRTMIKGSPSQYVKLNVGGTLYYATIGTLTKYDNMLKAMFSGRIEVLTDSEGWILVDRCGKHFGTVLSYLRDGSVTLPDTARELAELYTEAKYYCIQELSEACDSALKKLPDKVVPPVCRIPLIASSRDEQQLISQSDMPVIKLLINRHNNKYSYTSTSDDNMLKNLEVFDKLSLRFYHRILFIKDVSASNEICMWTFYGRGQKVAEVCCTSIVYATDKKHTKVECHEARIYEEMLNIMLYENQNSPDAELMQATARLPAAFGCTSDDDEPAAAAATAAAVVGGARSKHGLERLRPTKPVAHAGPPPL